MKEARNLFPRHELSAAGFWYTLVEFRDDKPDIELKIDIPDLDNLQKVEIYGYEPLYYLEEDEPKAHAYLARLRGSKATESAELLSAEHIIAVRLTPTASDEAQLLDTFEQLIRLHYPG
ncbi:MAG TPA: hypothetical protein VH144_00480 [Candidatus Saccharimonadales bacterium]|nr:hypothetical protein [Candidatus Saccharimonadales bacterium]